MTDHINTNYVNRQRHGLALSFAKQARGLHADHGAGHLTAQRIEQIKMFSNPETRELRARRLEIAQPAILGTFGTLPDGPNISSHGLPVKDPGSYIVGVPDCFDFTLPLAGIVGSDILSLYGPERFETSEILLVVQRSDIEPHDAHRPEFSQWHTHLGGPDKIDLIYSFCTILPTEFRVHSKRGTAPENSLTRFGAEIEHRSPTNESKETLRRVWGAFIVTDGNPVMTRNINNRAFNCATDESSAPAFCRAASRYLAQHANAFTAIDPSPLSAVA